MAEPPTVDASPLIILGHGGLLDLLQTMGERILVPRHVEQEVLRPAVVDAAVRALRSLPRLEVVEPGPVPEAVRRQRLDPGEEAVLSWALAHTGTIAIMDDRRGRRAAQALGVQVIGTLGLIQEAKMWQIIPAARPVIEHLLQVTDWYLSDDILAQVLACLGE